MLLPMKPSSSWLLVVASAVVGGAVGSGVTLALRRPEAPKREAPASERRAPSVAEAEPADEDDALSQRLRSLERRVSLLTAALSKTGAAVPPPDGQQGANAGEGAPAEDPADVASPVFEAAVRDILDRVDDERRQERQERRGVFIEQGSHEISDRLGEKLGLSDDQRQKVAEIVKQTFESMGALRELPPEERPKTPAEWRERREAQRKKTDEALARVLTPAQMESYRALPEDDQISARRQWTRGREGRERRAP